MSYKVPSKDFQFNLAAFNYLQQLQQLPGYEDFDKGLILAVLEENARLIENEIAPLNTVGDHEHATWHQGHVNVPSGFLKALQAYAQGGWQALQHDPAYGGQGFPKLVACMAAENLHAANLSFALCPMLTDGAIEALDAEGSAEQKQTYIKSLCEGKWTGTMLLTEPQAGSDLSQITTKAERQEDGGYRITGEKIFITWGEHDMTENIVHLVLARVAGAPSGVNGISLFVVPKYLINDDASIGKRNDVYCASIEKKLGIYASPTAVMLFGENHGDVGSGAVAYLVGQENEGLKYMFVMMKESRFNVGIQGVAISERATQKAWTYAAERIQGTDLNSISRESVSINHHPDVQRMLLSMRGLTQGARAIAMYAAFCRDMASKLEDKQQALLYESKYEYLIPIVKGYSTEMAQEVVSLGVQVHGGSGYVEETGAAQFFRDARILPIYEGTTAIQANDLLGRKIWRDKGQTAMTFIAEMNHTLSQLANVDIAHKEFLAERFKMAIDDYKVTTEYLLGKSASTKQASAFAGNVPYMMLCGYVHSAWLLLQSLINVKNNLSSDGEVGKNAVDLSDIDTDYLKQKEVVVMFFTAQLLPRTKSLSLAVIAGEVSTQAFAQTNFNG